VYLNTGIDYVFHVLDWKHETILKIIYKALHLFQDPATNAEMFEGQNNEDRDYQLLLMILILSHCASTVFDDHQRLRWSTSIL